MGLNVVCILLFAAKALLNLDHLQKSQAAGTIFLPNPYEYMPAKMPKREKSCDNNQKQYPRSNCSHWDWFETVVQPAGSVFVTTHANDHVERRVCEHWEPCGEKLWERATADKDYYIAAPENEFLMLEHSLYVPDFGSHKYSLGNMEMDGFVIKGSLHGEQAIADLIRYGIQQSDVVMHLPKGSADIISVEDLLESGSVDLEARSDKSILDVSGKRDETYRTRGLQMQLTIVYSNLWGHEGFTTGEMRYVVFCHHIPKTEAHITEIHLHEEDFSLLNLGGLAPSGASGDLRMKRTRYGVHLFIHQTGLVARFEWSALLSYIITFSALSTLAWNLVELFLSFYPNVASARPVWYEQLNHTVDVADVELGGSEELLLEQPAGRGRKPGGGVLSYLMGTRERGGRPKAV
jgi:hypothetical protein